MKSKGDFQCIECGSPALSRCNDYKTKGIIKITHCNECKKAVDKYIEYDPVIIYLDAMLLKIPVYRHILINEKQKWQMLFKLSLFLLLCDALSRWMLEKSDTALDKLKPNRVFYAALELSLYWNYLLAVCQWIIHISLILVFIKILDRYIDEKTSCKLLIKCIIISNFGKVLVIVPLLWGSTYSVIYLVLDKIFVTFSNIQALRVITNERIHVILLTVLVIMSTFSQELFVSYLPHTVNGHTQTSLGVELWTNLTS